MLPRTSDRDMRWRDGVMDKREGAYGMRCYQGPLPDTGGGEKGRWPEGMRKTRDEEDQQPVPDAGDGEKGRLEKGSRKIRGEVGPKTSYTHVRWGEGLIRKWTRKTRDEVGPRDNT